MKIWASKGPYKRLESIVTITMVSYGVKFSWYIFLALFSPYFQLFGYALELLVVSIPMKCNGSDQFGLFKSVASSM